MMFVILDKLECFPRIHQQLDAGNSYEFSVFPSDKLGKLLVYLGFCLIAVFVFLSYLAPSKSVLGKKNQAIN
jgi:hypothetical protein